MTTIVEPLDTKRMRACAPMLPEPGGDVVVQCLDEIERLRQRAEAAGAERDALRADALRYRWLRERCAWSMINANGITRLAFRLPIDYVSSDDAVEDFDAAIDAAMAIQTTDSSAVASA